VTEIEELKHQLSEAQHINANLLGRLCVENTTLHEALEELLIKYDKIIQYAVIREKLIENLKKQLEEHIKDGK
jgi:hypothetical protein